jgi:hypothetical protein
MNSSIAHDRPRAAIRWWPALGLLAVSAAMTAGLTFQPRNDTAVAAIFPPWWGAERAMIAAGEAGPILRQGAWPWIVVVAGPTNRTAPKLRAAGALLLVDPTAAGICGTPEAPSLPRIPHVS